MNREELGLKKKTDVIRYLGQLYLETKKANSPEHAIRPREIVAWIKRDYGHLELKDNTIWAQLSELAINTSNPVTNAGRGKGYFLSDATGLVPESGNDSDTKALEPENKTRVEREAMFYPSSVGWLIEQGYRSADTSSGRKLGRWGNPDITGIRGVEHFGVTHVEVASIEVKPSIDDWEYYIFEAVSHRRFANRAYFAFAHPWELLQKLPTDLKDYAEMYQIGILILGTDDEVYRRVKTGGALDPLLPDDIEMVEYFPAPRNDVRPEYQQRYLAALGITNQQQLWGWGQATEE